MQALVSANLCFFSLLHVNYVNTVLFNHKAIMSHFGQQSRFQSCDDWIEIIAGLIFNPAMIAF